MRMELKEVEVRTTESNELETVIVELLAGIIGILVAETTGMVVEAAINYDPTKDVKKEVTR